MNDCRGYSMTKNGSAEVKSIRDAKGTGKETRLRREERALKLQENKYKKKTQEDKEQTKS